MKEKRGEVYVNLGKALSPTLRVDGGVNYEYSNLKVRGDAIADRTLKFLKPNITLDWKPGGGWHAQVSVKRTVAQLDFYDFISVGDLSTKRINGGNADLEPQRTWEFRATVEHPLFGDGLFKLDLGHDLVSMLQDRILICDEIDHPGDPDFCADAPGNLGTGKRYFASLTLDAPLGTLWKGLRAKLTGTIQRTRVDGPDQRRAAQLERLLPRLAVGPDRPPRFRALLLRLRAVRQQALHLLPHRRVRYELQRRARLERIRRISPGREHLGDAQRRPYVRQARTACCSGPTAPIRRSSSTSSANATSTSASG